jgi:Skp family chaperone for outer membrane proteins
VVTDYSKSKKYTLILEKNANAVVFSNDAIDITKSITKAYDVKKGKTKTSIKKSTKKKK